MEPCSVLLRRGVLRDSKPALRGDLVCGRGGQARPPHSFAKTYSLAPRSRVGERVDSLDHGGLCGRVPHHSGRVAYSLGSFAGIHGAGPKAHYGPHGYL